MKPEYAQDIIVGVMRKKTFCWYVTNKVIWFLDYVKWGRAFDPNAEDSAKERFDILVVDDAHEEAFFEHIEPYRVSCCATATTTMTGAATTLRFWLILIKNTSYLIFRNLMGLKDMFPKDGRRNTVFLKVMFRWISVIGLIQMEEIYSGR